MLTVALGSTEGGEGHHRERGSSPLDLAVVMGGVFFLLSLGLLTAVNFLAAQATSTAAERALQIAQTPGNTTTQSDRQARQVASSLATASGVVTASTLDVSDGSETVTVSLRVRTVLGATISRTVTGPRLRFVPQTRS